MSLSTIDVPRLRSGYRNLVLWFGVQLLLLVLPASGWVSGSRVKDNLFVLVLIATPLAFIAFAYFAYRTAKALGSELAWLWAVAMLVPYANGLSLLALSSKVIKACRDRGIPVGFLGPKG